MGNSASPCAEETLLTVSSTSLSGCCGTDFRRPFYRVSCCPASRGPIDREHGRTWLMEGRGAQRAPQGPRPSVWQRCRIHQAEKREWYNKERND